MAMPFAGLVEQRSLFSLYAAFAIVFRGIYATKFYFAGKSRAQQPLWCEIMTGWTN
ncbi:hypothetical protein [Rhizobium oryziradicis]|uniref:hypothetical protein n=1 Tax=Rhizobium oryziradicis TaxID=1867956 RepID=UPI0015881CBE|nr:hypothetical protein [Rhizobium oryziradicis]